MELPLRALPLCALTLLTSPLAAAQLIGGDARTIRVMTDPSETGAGFGAAMSDAGDLDGDGHSDLVVGSLYARTGFVTAGATFVFSGRTGEVLWRWDGRAADEKHGRAVAGVGDLDGDGVPDVASASLFEDRTTHGYLPSGEVTVYSGSNGAVLYRLQGPEAGDLYGESLAGLGDVDGDGTRDFAAGAPLHDRVTRNYGRGAVYLHSGRTGALLRVLAGEEPKDEFGDAIAAIEDLDGDQVPDLIVGAPEARPPGLHLAGRVYLCSSATGAVLRRFDGLAYADYLGRAVAATGDLDGDGLPDVLAGAPNAESGGRDGRGSAFVFSSSTGQLLLRVDGFDEEDALGSSVATVGDWDGDHLPDLLLGAPTGGPWSVYAGGYAAIVSSRDGRLLFEYRGDTQHDRFGFCVASSDANGDGRDDAVMAAPWAYLPGLSGDGDVTVIGFDPYVRSESSTLSVANGDSVRVAIDFPAEEAHQRYALLVSGSGRGPVHLGEVAVPLSPDPIFLRMLTGWTPPILEGAFGRLDGKGDAFARYLPATFLSTQVGRTYFGSAVALDATTLSIRRASVAVPLRILP